MKYPHLVALAYIFSLSGCANLNSIYRTLEMGDAHGVAVDAKQRGIYSSSKSVTENGKTITTSMICPEPSPDALSAYSASSGLTGAFGTPASATTPATQAQVQAAMAFAEASASIGLRTQSIQLLRDGLFSNCIAYMNSAVSAGDFYALQRRSQNFTLGILAIEQLTGAVKADQVALSTASAAATGSDNYDKETAALDAALTAQNEAKTASEQGKLDLSTARTAVDTQKAKVSDAQKTYDTLKAIPTPDDATKTKTAEAKKALKTENEALTSKENELDNQKIKSEALDRTLTNESTRVGNAQAVLADAKLHVRAWASGTATVARAGRTGVIITDRVAKAVEHIVDAVLAESGKGEACYAAVEKITDDSPKDLDAIIGRLCPTAVKAKLRDLEIQGKGKEKAANKLLNSIM